MRHVFVTADAGMYPTVWKAAVPPVDRTNIYSMLQGRDLSENDYHLLLSLDGDNVPPLHRHLVQALEKVALNDLENISETRCNICTSLLSIDPDLRRMCCKNRCVVHESCALSFFIETESDSSGRGAASSSCPCCDDERPLFPSLRRQPRRKRETPQGEENANLNCVSAADPGDEVLSRRQACGDSVSSGFVVSGNVFGGISGSSMSGTGRPPVQARMGVVGTTTRQGGIAQGFRLRSAGEGPTLTSTSQAPQIGSQGISLSSQSMAIEGLQSRGTLRRSDSAPTSLSETPANSLRGTINRR